MRFWIGVAVILSFSVPANATDFRWGSSHTQGTSEAIIHSENGSNLVIYCPSGQLDTTPGMFVHSERVRPRAKEQITVQFVIDGETFSFILDESRFKADGRMRENEFISLVQALIKSDASSFIVEFPKFGMSERFSLRDARKVLGGKGGQWFLSGCI